MPRGRAPVPVSAALGELAEAEARLAELPGGAWGRQAAATVRRLAFVKVGLIGSPPGPDVAARLRRIATVCGCDAQGGPRLIVAVYADGPAVGAPSPTAVLDWLEAAGPDAIGVGGVLLDTADKRSAGVFGRGTIADWKELADRVRRLGLVFTLGGRLSADDGDRIRAVGPDVAAFRSAATDGDRDGPVTTDRVRRLVESFATVPSVSPR